uniref:Uncharacterized protein n=1 Tax=Trieres chinensis TaxID=1514140 RepID=A0A7S1Z400_TRICV
MVLSAVLALLSGTTNASSVRARGKADFMRTMQEAMKAEERAKFRKDARERMNKRLMAKAIPASSVARNTDAAPDFLRVDPEAGFVSTRSTKTATKSQRQLEDGGDDGEWANFGFDPSEYSLKYSGCSAIKMYTDMAEGNDQDVFSTKRFVVFRLCPSDECSAYGSCGSNYGEYLVPLDDYLEYYGTFKEEMMENYCDYCEQCMYFEKYFYGNRKLDDAGDDQVEEGDDAVDDAGDDVEHACKYYSQCVDYLKACDYDQWAEAQGLDDDQKEEQDDTDYTQFFECQEFEYGNSAYYIAPKCSEDGSYIEFGIFSDEYCANYVGNKVDISKVTGIDFSDNVLADYTPQDCISCHESDLPYTITNNDAEDDDEILELCENLYTESAKCNKHLYSAEDGSYMSYNQEANEGVVCSLIENVMSGSYDEDGYIKLDRNEFDITKINFGELTEASIEQLAGIGALTLGILTLIVWSCFLHRSIQQQSKMAILPPEQQFVRQESGVMIGRSMSRDFPENPENDHVLT